MSSRRNSLKSKSAKIAYMEEADDSGNVIEGTDVTYAASTFAPSPTKEKMNTSKKKSRRGDSSSPANGHTDSDSTIHPVPPPPRRDSKLKSREKEKSSSSNSSKKTVTYATRPSPKHSRTSPVIQSTDSYRRSRDEASYYGVDPATVTAASSRPRARTSTQRPSSYYGTSSRPPLSNQRYQMLHAHSPAPVPPTSYPPQPWAAAGAVSYPVIPQPSLSQAGDYFQSRPPPQQLLARFNRPASAMGYRAPAPISYADDYDSEDRGPLIRRASLNRKARDEEDRMRMPPPPPPRPSSARPLSFRSSAFAPPPRRSAGFENDDFDGDGSLYQDVSPLAQYDYSTATRVPRARRPSVGATSVVYDSRPYSTEVATSNSRRNSYYGNQPASSGGAFEEKLRRASTYQNEVEGGPSMPLTAETLRKASKTSSRSTRSSGSHDESDWRQSATTRTTRSSNDEDVTIRVKGTAVLKVGGAEMQCQDGAEINISSRGGPPGTMRGGSDKSSYMDADERRTRIDRPSMRNRATSQSGSYSRTMPRYDYGYGGSTGYGYDYTTPQPFAPAPNGWL